MRICSKLFWVGIVVVLVFSCQTIKASETAYYTMEGAEGSIIKDESGNQNNGTANGISWVKGIEGKAIEFDGLDDYITVPEAVATSNDFTFAAWVYWEGGPI